MAIIALPLLSRAAGDTIRIEAETLEPVHYEQFGEWCFEFNSATAIDGLNYKVQFQYASDEVTGTFTKENGLVSGIYNNFIQSIDEEGKVKWIHPTSLTLTVANKPTPYEGLFYLTLDADFVGDDGAAMEIFGIGHEIIEKFFMFVADTEHFISSSMYLNQYMRAISVF